MGRVIILKHEDTIKIDVNYKWGIRDVLFFTILISTPALITLFIFGSDIARFPEMMALEEPPVIVIVTSTFTCLIIWWLWGNYEELINFTGQNGIIEIVKNFGPITIRRHYDQGNIIDIVKDSKRRPYTPDERVRAKFFLWLWFTDGRRIKLTHPNNLLTEEDVDTIYGAIRPLFIQPPPIERLSSLPHITISENKKSIIISFRTNLRFISIRYHGFLFTLFAVPLLPIIIFAALGSEVFRSSELFLIIYSGIMFLIFFPLMYRWRKKDLTHNHSSSNLVIDTNAERVGFTTSIRGTTQNHPSISFKEITQVLIRTAHELTHLGFYMPFYTSYYAISLGVSNQDQIDLYETENKAEAMHVKNFLENFILG